MPQNDDGTDGQKPMSRDRTCHGVQQTTNAPRIIVMVRNDFRARFSCLLVPVLVTGGVFGSAHL